VGARGCGRDQSGTTGRPGHPVMRILNAVIDIPQVGTLRSWPIPAQPSRRGTDALNSRSPASESVRRSRADQGRLEAQQASRARFAEAGCVCDHRDAFKRHKRTERASGRQFCQLLHAVRDDLECIVCMVAAGPAPWCETTRSSHDDQISDQSHLVRRSQLHI
jgi:hypothetical protein